MGRSTALALGHLDFGFLASRSESVHLGCLKPPVRDTSGTQLWETTTLSQLSMTCPRGQVEQRRDATVLPEGAGTRRCAEPSAAGWREALGPPRKRQLLPLPLSQSTWGGALHPGSMPGAATTLSPGTSRASEGQRRVEGRGGEAHGLGARGRVKTYEDKKAPASFGALMGCRWPEPCGGLR